MSEPFEPASWTSRSIVCGDDDDLSEIDNDYFFLVQPTDDPKGFNSTNRRASLLRVPARTAQDAFDAIHAVQCDHPTLNIEPLRPRSITLYDEDFMMDLTPPAPPTHLTSPTGVATHNFDQFMPKASEIDVPCHMSLPEFDYEDDEGTPLEGLDLDELEMYFDDDDDDSVRISGPSSKYLVLTDELKEESAENKFADIFKALVSCFSPRKSCGGKGQHLKKVKIRRQVLANVGMTLSCPGRISDECNEFDDDISKGENVTSSEVHATASLVAIKYRLSNQVVRPDCTAFTNLTDVATTELDQINLPRDILVPVTRQSWGF